MKSSGNRHLILISLFLIAIAFWIWRHEVSIGGPATEQTAMDSNSPAAQVIAPGDEREMPSSLGKRPTLPKRVPAVGLAEINGREVAGSRVHAIIPAGHSMVTGGYVTENGLREFVVLTPKWQETPSGKKQVMLESKILNVDQQALQSTGLGSLVTGEQSTQQNAEVWSPEDVTHTLGDADGLDLLSAPNVMLEPGSSGQIRMGTDKASFMLDVEVKEAADGGFDLKSAIKRME